MTHHVRETCRLCGSRDLTKVLELPPTPLANEFPTAPNVDQEKFPLWLAACDSCAHVQLPVVVDPERLFRDYVYVSGTSPVFRDHFKRYADELCADYWLKDRLVVEIGSNDGTLLGYLKANGTKVLGIEPAEKIAKAAMADGIPSWPVFFTHDVADKIVAQQGHASLVVANNVFAHADDLTGIVRAVKRLLTPEGFFVFEVSYLPDVIRGTLFDTIYHEHLAFHTVAPLIPMFANQGMSLVEAKRVNTHGGSIRITVSAEADFPPEASVQALCLEEFEMGLTPGRGAVTRATFGTLQQTIHERRDELMRVLHGARMAGKRIAAYGAPAKATTLLHTFGIEHGFFDFVVDDSPHKQGRYLPGTDIPVRPFAAIEERKPDMVVVLAWNFAESILKKLTPFMEAGGICVVPLPHVVQHGIITDKGA